MPRGRARRGRRKRRDTRSPIADRQNLPARWRSTIGPRRFWVARSSAKGSVENTNGRLRRQLPRHLDLDTVNRADRQEIVLSHNLTPRKCLGYLIPIQAFFKGLGKDVQVRFASLAGLCAWRGNPPPRTDYTKPSVVQ